MTLRNSSLKSLSLEDLKQSKYFIIIHTIILLLISSLPAGIMINNYNYMDAIGSNYIIGDTYASLCLSMPYTFFAVCAIGTIIGTINFSYLFNTKSVIFYHSMPHKRETIFVSKLISGIASIIIPLCITAIVNMIIYFSTGFFEDVNFMYFINSYLFIFLMYVFVFSISAFAASISSNVFAQYIVLGFIYLVYPITALVITGVVEVFTKTFSLTMPFFDCPEYLFPPFKMITEYLYFDITDTGNENLLRYTIELKHVIYTLVVSLIAMVAAVLAYKKRKTESTNKFISFNAGKTFLKYYITSIAAIGAALIFYEISYQRIIGAIVGLILGAFIVHSVLQAIFEKSLKSMFANVKSFVFLTVILCVVVVSISYVAKVFDSKFPENSRAITIKSSNLTGISGENIVLEDENNIKAATEFFKKAAITSTDENFTSYANYFRVTTNAYDFFGIQRNFNRVKTSDIEEFLSKVYDSKEYKASLTDFEEDITTTKYAYINAESRKAKYAGMIAFPQFKDINTNDIKEFLEIIKADIRKYTYEDIKNSDIEFVLNLGFDNSNYQILIRECFKDTFEAMKKYGWLYEGDNGIRKMALVNFATEGSEYDDNYAVIDDNLIELMQNVEQGYASPYYDYTGDMVLIRYYAEDGRLVETADYRYDMFPEEMKKYIEENKIPISRNTEEHIKYAEHYSAPEEISSIAIID